MFSFASRLWSPVVVDETIPAPPEDVYGVLRDPNTYPDWLVGADRMREVDAEFPAPGSKFEHSVGPGGPLTIDDRTESVGAERNRSLSLRVHAGPFHGRVDFVLEPTGDGGTKLTLTERPIGAFAMVTPLLRPTLYARNRGSLAKLRDVVIERSAAPR